MAAAAGVFNHHTLAAGQALTRPQGQAAASGSATPVPSAAAGATDTSSTDSSSATISANDFLTLLVTEMQNQDPTADTDPNEYIDQLVQVNSLEQLIDINQNLSTALGDSTSSDGTAANQTNGATANATGVNAAGTHARPSAAGRSAASMTAASASAANAVSAPGQATGINRAPGNLGIPAANPAANRVAQALSGQS